MKVPTVQIVVSSPSDVSKERGIARRVVHELSRDELRTSSCRIDSYFWEEDSIPGVGLDAQAVVNSNLFDSEPCDIVSTIVVCVLWTRLGTATRYCASGTVEEVLRALVASDEQNLTLLFYHGNRFVQLKQIDLEQLQGVRTFETCFSRYGGLRCEYASLAEFEKMIRQHLRQSVDTLAKSFSAQRRQHNAAKLGDNFVDYARQLAADLRGVAIRAQHNAEYCIDIAARSASIAANLERQRDSSPVGTLRRLLADFVSDIDRRRAYTSASLECPTLRRARVLISFSALLSREVQEHILEVQRSLKLAVSALKRQADTVIGLRRNVVDPWPTLLFPIPADSAISIISADAEYMSRLEAEIHAVERLGALQS